MSDNVSVTPGAGASIATDDVGGIQYQLVKPAFGEDGTATMVSDTDPLPIAAATLPLPDGAASESTQQDVLTALTDPIAELPPQPIVATSPFTYIRKTSSSATTTTIIAAPGVGLTVRCYRYRIVVDTDDIRVQLKDGTGNVWGDHYFTGGKTEAEGHFWQWPYNGLTPENDSLTMVTDVATNVYAEFWVANT